MSKGSEAVKRWRHNTKQKMIDSLGGKCALCGYDKCQYSLTFHHLDQSKKEIAMGSIRGSPIAWSRIVEELKKCICICANCHGEVHDGLRTIPEDVPRFDESFSVVPMEETIYDTCPSCGKSKIRENDTCSKRCSRNKLAREFWGKIDLYDLRIKQGLTFVQIGKMIGRNADYVSLQWRKTVKL